MVTTTSALTFAFTIHMLERGCPLLPSFTGRQRGHRVFPRASSKVHTSDTSPGYKSYETRVHCKNDHSNQTIKIGGLYVQEKGELVSFQRNRSSMIEIGIDIKTKDLW